MVQGITNSINIIQQGGSNLVYAVNDTDTTLSEGDKVWLNVVTNENSYRKTAHSSNRGANYAYSIGHNLYYYNTRYVWNGRDFVGRDYTTYSPNSNTMTLNFRPWGVFQSGASTYMLNDGRTIELKNETGVASVLNNTYAKQDLNIVTYSLETGKILETVGTFPKSTFTKYYMPDNSDSLLVYTQNQKTMDIYEDFHNPTEGHRTFTLTEYAYPMWVTNGLSDNSYFICNTSGTYPERLDNAKPIVIYKLSNNTLQPATDLPETLQQFMRAANTWATYKDDTKILTIFNGSRVYAWRATEDGFKEIVNMSVTLTKPFNAPNRMHYAYFNDDLTGLVLWYNHETSSYVYADVDFNHYNIIDGKWHVTPYAYNNESTLTGWATGVTNEVGEVEVKTVLPPEVTMTFNITPDEDTFTYQGITA